MKVILSGLREEWSEFNLNTIVLKNRDWRRLKWKGEESLVPFAMRAALCNYSFPLIMTQQRWLDSFLDRY